MSTVTVDVPDDLRDELRRFLDEHPEFEDEEDLILAFTNVMLETGQSIAEVERAEQSLEQGEEGDTAEYLEEAVEANREATAAILEFFGVHPPLSEETIERVEQSKRDFEDGDFVPLEEV